MSDDDSHYECRPIREFIAKTAPLAQATRAYRIGHLHVQVSVYSYAGSNDRPERVCDYVRDVVSIVASLPFARCTSQSLYVRVWLTSFRKQWCVRETHSIGPCHVNSGITTFGRTITVDVYRRECCMKTLFHEILHVFNVHDLAPGLLPGEAVVESLALILFLWILAVDDRDAYAMLDIERQWMHKQVQHLHHHRWTSTTNTHAYYVLKTGLLSRRVLPWFLRWIFGDRTISWSTLHTRALQSVTQDLTTIRVNTNDECISMRMTVHDLVLV